MVDWLILLAVLTLALYIASVLALVMFGRRSDARALAGFIPDCLVLFRRLLAEPRVGRCHKALVAGMVAYLALPFDLVPDFIPLAGQLDDAILVAFVLRSVLRGPRSRRGATALARPGAVAARGSPPGLRDGQGPLAVARAGGIRRRVPAATGGGNRI